MINYEQEVKKVYSVPSEISCTFYYDKKAKEYLWHVDVISYEKMKQITIGKGLFKSASWQSAYNHIQKTKQHERNS